MLDEPAAAYSLRLGGEVAGAVPVVAAVVELVGDCHAVVLEDRLVCSGLPRERPVPTGGHLADVLGKPGGGLGPVTQRVSPSFGRRFQRVRLSAHRSHELRDRLAGVGLPTRACIRAASTCWLASTAASVLSARASPTARGWV